MTVRRIQFEEALRVLESEEGAVYLDVRSVPEFEAGHPAGAYNIPLVHRGPMGPQPNQAFATEAAKAFPLDTPIVVGCQAGGRSARAAAALAQQGFTRVYDYAGGFGGCAEDPGWMAQGGDISTQPEAGRAHAELGQG